MGLADLVTRPAAIAAKGRRIKPMGDDPLDAEDASIPRITPFVAADAKGDLITAAGERAMPSGVYERKPRAKKEAGQETAPANDGKPGKRRRRHKAPVTPAKPRMKRSGDPRFGVFDDGSVELRTGECKGRLSAEEARELVDFIGRFAG